MDKQRLLQIVKNAWSAFSQAQLQLCSEPMNSEVAADLSWCVCAGIEPGHKSLLLGIDPQTARQLAADMFETHTRDTDEHQIEDAVTEMVNIISGNVITDSLTGGRLELPERIDSQSFAAHFDQLPLSCDLLLKMNKHPLYIAIVDENPLVSLNRYQP